MFCIARVLYLKHKTFFLLSEILQYIHIYEKVNEKVNKIEFKKYYYLDESSA